MCCYICVGVSDCVFHCVYVCIERKKVVVVCKNRFMINTFEIVKVCFCLNVTFENILYIVGIALNTC